MLVGIFAAVSALISLGVSLSCGAFGTMNWLWFTPVVFAVAYLGCWLVGFVALCIACAVVDLNKPQEKDNRFYRIVAELVIGGVMTQFGIKVKSTGMEKVPAQGRFILMCNHRDDSDPAILLHCFRKYQLAFISKWENYSKFVIGPVMHKILCQPINRENDREALKTILKCIDIIKQDLASIAVFPEGYIHDDLKLHPFRPGVFKIAQRTKVPVVICTLKNTPAVFPNLYRLKPTTVELNVLDVLYPEDYEGKSTVEISHRVHAMMAADLGPELVFQAENT